MSAIITVLGEISPSTLGFTHSHEHLSIDPGKCQTVNAALCIDNPDLTKQELCDYHQAGGRAVVDAQPVGCGRNAVVLRNVSEKSHVHIVASTGFHKMQFYPDEHWIFSLSASELTALFQSELLDGMFLNTDTKSPTEQTGIRAGIIKAALDSGNFTPQYQKLFQAAAHAAITTGAALMVHIEKGSDPLALANYLISLGLSANRMIFCHMDRMIPELQVHYALCNLGIYLEYDTIARPKYHSDELEAGLVRDMICFGFEDKLLMGLDVTRDRFLSYGGTVGLPYIKKQFIPLLLQHGIPPSAIDKIFVTNPARVLQFIPLPMVCTC